MHESLQKRCAFHNDKGVLANQQDNGSAFWYISSLSSVVLCKATKGNDKVVRVLENVNRSG